tara:strand:- start:28 stop:648 length:621 start_codon:yes stop_codon:yes gene_type:complete
MKKLAFIILLISIATLGFSQGQVEISAFSGYTFKSEFNISGGDCKVRDGYTGGMSLGFYVDDNYSIDIMYTRQRSQLRAQSIFLDEVYRDNISINYILIGGNRLFTSIDDDFQPYGGIKIGAVIIDYTDPSQNQIVKFAANANLGVKYYLSDVLGLKAGMNLSFPITDAGASLGWSSGGGTSVGVSTWSPIAQFAFLGGITVRLGN